MKKIAFAIIAFFAVTLSVNAAQISEQARAVLSEIEKSNKSLTTIKSPVTEKRILPNGKEFVAKGTFYFSNPGLLAIRYTTPEGDYLVINTQEVAQKKKQGKTFKLSIQKNATMQNCQ